VRIAIDQYEWSIHLTTRHPAGAEIVGQSEERVVKRANLDALDAADNFVNLLVTKTGHNDDLVDSGGDKLAYLPLENRHATRAQTTLGRHISQWHESTTLAGT
jgi:hypothetical protein